MLSIVQGADNKVLRANSMEVSRMTPLIKSFASDMLKNLQDTKYGIGLAAPQAGKNLRIFVIFPERIWQENDPWLPNDLPRVFINPELKNPSRAILTETEGCLSLPDLWMKLSRPKKITITAIGLDGEKIKIHAKGLLARVFQHEVDHLDGLLIVDRVAGK